jgi:hypothetical protein
MTRPLKKPAQHGPSSVLISCIEHLQSLLQNLPKSLPLDPPETKYHFGMDVEHVVEEGTWFAFNRSLEVCFEIHKLGPNATIVFRERGQHYETLIQMFKDATKALTTDAEHEFLHKVWLECLIKAAELQGATHKK